jgi:hypothetical protein
VKLAPAIPAVSQPQTQTQPRRTATQVQLSSLPQVLEAEERAGNQMPGIADHWACMNIRCRNKGKTCWRSKMPGAPDTADDHYPIPPDLFRRWSKEINDGISTLEQPSPQLIIALCRWRDRDRKKDESAAKLNQQSAASTAASTTSELLNVFLVTQLRQLTQQSTSSSAIQHSAPLNSSPFRTQMDPQELLAEFFDWIIKQPSCNTERKIELFKEIKSTLIEEQWELDTLRERRDRKGITNDI